MNHTTNKPEMLKFSRRPNQITLTFGVVFGFIVTVAALFFLGKMGRPRHTLKIDR